MASDRSTEPLLLSHALRDGTPAYPGDPEVRIRPALTLAQDGVAVAELHLGSHSGTHVDAPAHTVPDGRTADRLAHAELCGPALVLGLADPAPEQVLSAARLARLLPAGDVPARVLIATGWDAHWEDDALRERHPVLAADAARLLWRRGMRLLGVDTLSPDATCGDGPAADTSAPHAAADPTPDFPVHETVLGEDGIIVENLCGLGALRPAATAEGADWCAPVHLEVHPLPLADGDGAPARVLAWPASEAAA